MKIPLLQYLDLLEATATNRPGEWCSINGAIAQALVAKLREAVEHMRVAAKLAIRHRPADIINDFQDDVVAWAQIEVPE